MIFSYDIAIWMEGLKAAEKEIKKKMYALAARFHRTRRSVSRKQFSFIFR